MKQFKHIAVLQNANRPPSFALTRAIRLAKKNDAKLSVFDIVDTPNQFLRTVLDGVEGLLNEVASSRTEQLNDIIEPLRNELTCSAQVFRGRPLPKILRAVVEKNCDVLIKDAKANTADLFFGSLDMRLLRYCPVPLWLTKADAPQNPQRILVAVDPTASNHSLNNQIIGLASELAKRDSAELHVVAIWQAPFDLLSNEQEHRETHDKYKHDIERAAKDALQGILSNSETPVSEHRVHFDSGVENDEIVNVVDSLSPDVLVMGTLARTGIAGILIGNTAEKVLRRVRCSVLTLKPDDFESPVISDSDDE